MDQTGTIPLLALLGKAHDVVEAEFDARLRDEFPDLTRAQGRNVLRHFSADGCQRVSQLSDRSGVSKQALSLQIASLEKAGYLTTGVDPDDGRARRVALTERGVAAQAAVVRIVAEIDTLWRERLGADWEHLVAAATRIVESDPAHVGTSCCPNGERA